MTQHKATIASITAVILIVSAAYWWFTSSQYVDALMEGIADISTAVHSHDATSGAIAAKSIQTDSPVKQPFGDAAGPIVDAHTMTVAQVVAQIDASEFASLFSEANGGALVSGSGKFTIFVPTNGAMNRLPKGTVSRMTASEKARLVAYHVIRDRALDTDALVAGSVQTVSGDALNVSLGVNNVPLIGSAIVITQYNCKNGVVYTINNVLLPPAKVNIH